MKKVTIKFPLAKANDIATIIAANGFQTLLSYSDEDGFFNKHLVVILCFPEDKETNFTQTLSQYVKK
jgi:hypothetical protein